jgi:AraC-like DNA-binding protein
MSTTEEQFLTSILLAQGLAPAAARAAFDAAEARDARPPRLAALRPGGPAQRREKMFGMGRPRALDRNAKTRIMHMARCLSRRTEKGRAYGRLTAKFVEVLRVLLWTFHNRHSGICFPSLATIAEAAGCSRATVATAIKALEGEGIITWVNRIRRVRESCPDLLGTDGWRWRVVRTSNGYSFNDPGGLASSQPSKSKSWAGTTNQVSFSSLEVAFGDERERGAPSALAVLLSSPF